MNAAAPKAAFEPSAQERLIQSREQMSRWLEKQGPVDGGTAEPDQGQLPGATTGLRSLFSNPVTLIGLDYLTEWWTQHPLVKSARNAEDAAQDAIVPLVRRHPVAVLGTAAAVGALLVWFRPWRWLPRPGKLASMASTIAIGEISRIALQRKEDSPHADR